VLWLKVGLGGLTCQAGRPARVAGRPSFMATPTLGNGYPVHQSSLTRWQSGIWKGANTWPAGPTLALLGPGFVPQHPLMSYSLWMRYFGHIENMHGFWSIWRFSVIRCSWNGRSIKLIELVSNKHLSSISWMKCMYVGGKYMHFTTTNTCHLANLLTRVTNLFLSFSDFFASLLSRAPASVLQILLLIRVTCLSSLSGLSAS
jgi:hypothetical protein